MLILTLDCSTARGSVAIAVGAGLGNFRFCWRADFPAGRGRGGLLFTTLEAGLAETRHGGEELGEIVVGLGPGSFSGVRQAIAVATGLALATGARLRGQSSMVALRPNPMQYHAVSDARRGAYYYAAVEIGVCTVGPELLPDVAALRTRLDARPDWPVQAVETLPPGLSLDTPVTFPQADCLLLGSRDSLTPPPLEPIYLRPVSITLPKPK